MNKILHRIKISVLFLVAATFLQGLLFTPQPVHAEERNMVNIYMFWGNGCPHCAKAKEYLVPFAEKTPYAQFFTYEVYYSAENQQKMQAVGETLGVDASGVPLILVGDKAYVGYSDTIGRQITTQVRYCSLNACPDSVAAIVGASVVTEPVIIPDQNPEPANNNGSSNGGAVGSTSPAVPNQPEDGEVAADDDAIALPLLGEVKASSFSLPVLTVIIGSLDGFNPCAMWALLFIISLLIGMNDRRRMWLYGTTFIATSAFVYLLFMAAWLSLFTFIAHIAIVRALIGGLAVGVGAYYLYDYYQKKTGCKITGNGKRQAFFAKMRDIVHKESIWLGLGGIIVLAAAVNIVELACSAGLTVIYTGVLSAAGLSAWQNALYLLLYILFFMLDDLIVFFIAMTTLKIVGIDSKYTRATRLIGGVLMVTLGLLLMFAPEVLMFG